MFGNHLAGIYEKAFKPDDDWATRLGKAKQLGFDFIEISIDETDARIERLYWSKEEIESLRRVCFSSDVAISSMCLSAHRRFPFGSEDSQCREKAHEIMALAIDFAAAMGIRVIQLAGYDVYYEASTPQSVHLFREGMIWAAAYAAKKQVMLAMEIMDTPFMNSITKHMGYECMVHSPWYKVYPDLGNLSAWGENDPDTEIAVGINSIVGVHLKDTLRVTDAFPGKFKCVPFGDGCVNFAHRFAQLERLQYTGPYLIEMWHTEGTDDIASVQRAAAWLETQYAAGVRGMREAAIS